MAELCAPGTASDTLRRIAAVESSFNPYAIGVVGGRLARQPKTRAEALATANMLAQGGYDYSVGIIQINQKHFGRFGLTADAAFDPCVNLRVGSTLFQDCFRRAGGSPNPLGDALSCYYSGNFTTGYREGYVSRVLGAQAPALDDVRPIALVAGRAKKRARRDGTPVAPSDSPFVSPPMVARKTIAAGDASSPAKGQASALLF